MIPRKREFEQVAVDEWIPGEIVDIQYEQEHEFTYKGNKKIGDAVKILIRLDGYKDNKSTGWWAFNYSEKSNLYNIFIKSLVPGATPNMSFDLDGLKGMKIKAMYAQNGEYQNLAMVRPLAVPAMKNAATKTPRQPLADVAESEPEEETPF